MPYYKSSYRRKRPYRRPTPTMSIVRRRPSVPLTCPTVMKVKLRYTDLVVSDTTGTFAKLQTWALNNCHDPDQTGAGSQPMGWDQWKAFYENYVVSGCKLECRAFNAAGSDPANVVIFPHTDEVTPATMDEANMIKGSRSLFVPSDGTAVNFSQYYDIQKLLGIKDLSTLAADVDGGPTDSLLVGVYTENATQDTSAIGLTIQTRLTYYVTFGTPKLIADS